MSLVEQKKSPRDKKLVSSSGYEVDTITNDLKIVEGDDVILQAAQNRILAERGSLIYDINYGSTMRQLLRIGRRFNDEECLVVVKQALEPMVQDGRIAKVVSVKVLEQEMLAGTIYFKVVLLIGAQQYTQSYTLNFL